jgi:hypothetical protein
VGLLIGFTALSASAYTLTGTGYLITNETVSVIVPSTLDFTIDPLEIGGSESVYSDEYPLVNLGGTDVILTFTSVEVILANDRDFAKSALPVGDSDAGGLKSVYLELNFGNGDIPPIVLTDVDPAEIPSVTLGANGSGTSEYALRISGSVNPYPLVDWQSGDIRIAITYRLDAVAPSEPDAAPAQTPEPDAASVPAPEPNTNPAQAPEPGADPAPTPESPEPGAEPPVAENSAGISENLTEAPPADGAGAEPAGLPDGAGDQTETETPDEEAQGNGQPE